MSQELTTIDTALVDNLRSSFGSLTEQEAYALPEHLYRAIGELVGFSCRPSSGCETQ